MIELISKIHKELNRKTTNNLVKNKAEATVVAVGSATACDAGSSPSCLTLDPAVEDGPSPWASALTYKTQMKTMALVWSSPSCYGQLDSEPAHGKISLCPPSPTPPFK